ncbi:MAG: HAD-IA family hydrolase [Muribaculaceae bacterium]|nr:HAD-IA family hydrolase [Muribaculaceae bacterium]
MQFKGIRAALIDMDGVLYDSMKYHTLAWQRMMAEYGVECDRDEFYLYEGMTGAATIDLIFERELGRKASDEEKREMYRRKTELFNELGRKELMPGAQEMIATLRRAGIRTVLVTGSGQGSLLGRLDEDYPGAFPADRRVTAHDVTHGKPDPEPYLRGLEKAGTSPEETIVIENAPLGVRAGVASGCRTLAVTTGSIPREAFEAENPAAIFPSMEALRDEFARELNVLRDAVERLGEEGQVFIITDSNVERLALPRLAAEWPEVMSLPRMAVEPGEENKNIASMTRIWEFMAESGATRHALLVNIGGGMVTDMGGFAAATFKRGVRCVNVPTTLLGAVDAATGGKTGVDLGSYKNEVGAFHSPEKVIIDCRLFGTLPHEELLSGFGEMLKTGLIADPELYSRLLEGAPMLADPTRLEPEVMRCVEIKREITQADPTEKGIRKALNFGHTVGHAMESLCLEKGTPVPHGIAVAHGILVALILSHLILGMDSAHIYRYRDMLRTLFPRIGVSCADVPRLLVLMGHDKKNSRAGRPNFTLLRAPGEAVIDCNPSAQDIRDALDIYFTEL